jgi:hypothetical protein
MVSHPRTPSIATVPELFCMRSVLRNAGGEAEHADPGSFLCSSTCCPSVLAAGPVELGRAKGQPPRCCCASITKPELDGRGSP